MNWELALKQGCADAAEQREAESELERLRDRQQSNEDQLCRVAAFLGKDARDAPEHDRSIAGLVIAEIERLRAENDQMRAELILGDRCFLIGGNHET